MEFKEFESRFKSAKTRFKLSASLNLETFDTILSGTNHIKTATYNLNRRSNSLNSISGLGPFPQLSIFVVIFLRSKLGLE